MGTRKKVQAFVRVKPTDDFAHDMIKYGDDNKSIDIHLKKNTRRGVVNNQQTDWSFKLDGVLHDATQDLVYETVAKDAVSQALDGYNAPFTSRVLDGAKHAEDTRVVHEVIFLNVTQTYFEMFAGTIMCYGQTGAGKTYTMTGATENYKHRGILPRALQQVFRMIEERPTHAITVRVSYLEIYNENLFDLLSTLPYVGPSVSPMTIVENPQGVFIKGLSVHLTSQEEDAFSLLFEGETNRIIASHTMNKNSSRSHCIFTIYVEAHSRTLSDEKYITSKINLVDLAGSERLGKTGSEGRVLKEATYINKSLSFLEQAIIALGDQKRDHIPFRQCKLTHALKDSLGGNCNMVLVTNIYGEAAQLEETLSSLKFASRMKLVTTEPAINEKYDAERMVKNLEKELALLKQELAIHDSLNGPCCSCLGSGSCCLFNTCSSSFKSNRTLVNYDPMDEIQIAEINSQVRRYLEGTLDEIDAGLMDAEGHLVGEPDGQSFGLGVAPFSIKPGKKIKSKKTGKEQISTSARKEGASSPGSGKDLDVGPSVSKTQLIPSSKDGDIKDMLSRDRETSSIEPLPSDSPKEESRPIRPSTPPPKPVAFEDFKNERGSEINRIFKENKSILNERRKRASETTQRINAIKQEIDVTKEALNFQKSLREKQGQYENKGLMIIDEEEFLLILKLKDLKKQYRNEYQELRDLRAEIQYCQRLVDQCRNRLLMGIPVGKVGRLLEVKGGRRARPRINSEVFSDLLTEGPELSQGLQVCGFQGSEGGRWGAVSLTLVEFDIWYNESFVIPEEIQTALKIGSSIRPGMVPVSRIVSLGEDDQDRFSQLQQTVLPEGPDSISFYNAKVKTEQKVTWVAHVYEGGGPRDFITRTPRITNPIG
ncbi:Kinesin-like protein KIF9 [Cricetulus griseus]|uniref:Kinesin-like protein n=1 Tax=Cricetulus griseus TaxID=10029 RepID=G3HKR7_CRIGR|nr:Kinesin-like protein KIF9 [Cricetulus griseus]